ncbi:MAG: nucleotidyltransferase domain-containing protein [Candidatus Parcubacteria bacterium]|nr:nucleotidyltransferase domain-containing protein [Candidatus Parcubacteria bacterium]
MKKSHHQIFKEFLQTAKTDNNIIGVFLGGSRGKGYENESSDYDIWIIVKDKVLARYKKKYKNNDFDIDYIVYSLTQFEKYALLGSDSGWDRYNFTRVKALIDKNGKIQKLLNDKGSLSKDKKEEYIKGQLDAYVNSFYRSVKAIAKNESLGARLEAANSIPLLLNALFGLHNRITPFPNYLSRELKTLPMAKLPFSSGKFLNILMKILKTGDLKTQQLLAKTVEKLFRKSGYGSVLDNWSGKDKWAMNYKLNIKK